MPKKIIKIDSEKVFKKRFNVLKVFLRILLILYFLNALAYLILPNL